MLSAFFGIAAMGIAALACAPGEAQTTAPRTPTGVPDLQGIWQARNSASFDVAEIAEGHEIPYRVDALEREQKGDRVDPIAHCAMPGVPRITYMPFPFQIIQRPGTVVFCLRVSAQPPHRAYRAARTPGRH